MKIYDAIYTAAVLLQLGELTDALQSGESEAELSGESAAELDLLLRCCTLVLCELSETDFPLKTRTTLIAEDGRIAYDAFPQKATDIVSVRKGNRRLPFSVYCDGIAVPESGKLTVEYTFAPPAATLSGVSPYAGNKPSARLVAYGIAREYCLIGGMTDDAAMWDARFTACCAEQAIQRHEKIMRPRSWY